MSMFDDVFRESWGMAEVESQMKTDPRFQGVQSRQLRLLAALREAARKEETVSRFELAMFGAFIMATSIKGTCLDDYVLPAVMVDGHAMAHALGTADHDGKQPPQANPGYDPRLN